MQLILGQYRPQDSFCHNLDPRAKILTAILVMVLAIMTSSYLFYLATMGLLLIIILISRISVSSLWSGLKPFFVMVAITALYHLIFSGRDTSPLIGVWGLELTTGGVLMAITFSLRVLIFVLIALFISYTTMPVDLAEALTGWLKPLRKIGVPVNDINMVVFIAMRFVPVLVEEFEIIRKAQTVRGVDFSGGLIKRIRKILYLLVPVLRSALRRADELALAIESRGYVSGKDRTAYRQLVWREADIAFLSLGTAIFAALFVYLG